MSRDSDEFWRGSRIGILGGTFDPPHVGHMRMAAAARDTLDLDRVLFSPAPDPPHKRGVPVSDLADRRGMLEAAVADEPAFAVTAIEADNGPSFTVDLLRAAASRTGADLYFILGADSLAEIATWREPEEILRLCTLVVFPRHGHEARLPVAGAASLIVFESPRVDVSSTGVRAALARGEDAAGDVPPPVVAYIRRHALYRRP